MNTEMAYLLGMILGNGEVQHDKTSTTITIEIPYKNLRTEDDKDVEVYVSASLENIRSVLDPLLNQRLISSKTNHSTKISFSRPNDEYVMREILRYIGAGRHHSSMKMSEELFSISNDEKKSLLRGIADVTGYIRGSNYFIKKGMHRVYIEIPGNWCMVIDVAKMLRSVGIPVQSIDFGHPNFRDGNLKKFNEGKKFFWKKEHQIKIFANEFLPIGFNIKHKQESLERYADELVKIASSAKTHKFYWEKPIKRKKRPVHPGEKDDSLPKKIRGKHFESWTDIAEILGYGK